MTGPLKIMARACDGCLLTPNRIVSGERAAEIVRATRERANERHFLCHKGHIASPRQDIVCALHAERFPSQAVQVATRLTAAGFGKFVAWIDPETLEETSKGENDGNAAE